MLDFYAVDCGHGDKGDRYDPGAVRGDLVEAVLVRRIAPRLIARLQAAGADIYTPPEGPYSSRHAAVKAAAAGKLRGVYLQLHLNAGGGRYALVRPDGRSTAGRAVSAGIAAALDAALPELVGSRGDPVYSDSGAAAAAGRDVSTEALRSWWTRGHNCLSGIWPVPAVYGLIVEVGFIDQPAHDPLWTEAGIERIAAALADALLRL
jgi:N-acetylmuramoyl-L-alanine amidase